MGLNGGGPGHLLPGVAALLGRPVEERIWFARKDKWIGYATADAALAAMRDLVHQPRQLRRRGVLLAGRPNNGKSTILARFVGEHPVATREDGQAECPAVSMAMPTKADEGEFWGRMLEALRVPYRQADPAPRKRRQALEVLALVRCRVLVVDEVHNLLLGHAAQQRQLLAVLRAIVNDLQLPLVAAGTVDAIRAIATDPQVSTRLARFDLPRWELGREFLRLLASLEAVLPLAEPSGLATRELAMKLFELSSGTIGGVVDALKDATVLALRQGRERIDLPLLERLGARTVADYGRSADRL